MNRTSEWLKARTQGIGGSDIAAIAGLSPFKSPLAVYLDKRGEIESQPDNERMLWGRKLEDVVARHFAETNDVKVHRVNRMLHHPKYDFFIANLDRVVVSPKAVLEIKTGGARQIANWQEGELPTAYELQARWYMMVTQMREAYVAALLGGQEYVQVHLDRDPEIEDYMTELALRFWEMVQAGTPPEPTYQDTDLVRSMHPQAEPISIVLPESLDYARLSVLRTRLKEQEQEVTQLENCIKSTMGDAELAYLPGDERPSFTWKNQSRMTLDTKRLKAELPEVYERYARETTSRVFRVRGE